MKKHFFNSFVILATLVLGLTSCNDSGDSTDPTIEIVSPINEDEVHLGDTLTVRLNLSDNEALASYKVEIHYNDGHVHTKQSSVEPIRFTYNKTFGDVAGKKNAEVSVDIIIPETIDNIPVKEGGYHLGIYCLDSSKRQSEKFIEIDLVNSNHVH